MINKSRKEILDRFRNEIAKGNILLGVGTGIGNNAKCCETGGADLLILYNSGRFKKSANCIMTGLMSFGDSNKIVVEEGTKILPSIKKTPVLAGVCGTDPFRVIEIYLKQLKEMGFNGVQNFPTVGFIDGVFRQHLEETATGYKLEVEMIRSAHELDMITVPYVFNPEQAKSMTEAGADILVAHMGLVTKGPIGLNTSLTLDDCVDKINEIISIAKEKKADIMVFCSGGPIEEPEDVKYIFERADRVDGFLDVSSIERFETESGMKSQVNNFKSIKR